MNTRLEKLQPYPFERLNALLEGVKGNPAYSFIPLSLGEPKHPAPAALVDLYRSVDVIREGLATYPPTKGLPELREAIAGFIHRRYQARVDPETQVLPVNGTREALFAIAQAIIEPTADTTCLMPNPFYQIYEGAAILAGSRPVYVPCPEDNGFSPDFSVVTEKEWERCSLVYICTPGNPTGAVMSIAEMQSLIERADKYDFVIVSDECYSELHDGTPPPGLLEAATAMGRTGHERCLAFNSLSKRSNLPGLRSGYVCGDADLMEKYLLYRTYHGSAMSVHNQLLSAAAWRDDEHVEPNRQLYRDKFDTVARILGEAWPMRVPSAGFYLWPETPIIDTDFAVALMREMNVKVVPGTYLGRERDGHNPGSRRIRMALVATLDECTDAAERLRDFMQTERWAAGSR